MISQIMTPRDHLLLEVKKTNIWKHFDVHLICPAELKEYL